MMQCGQIPAAGSLPEVADKKELPRLLFDCRIFFSTLCSFECSHLHGKVNGNISIFPYYSRTSIKRPPRGNGKWPLKRSWPLNRVPEKLAQSLLQKLRYFSTKRFEK